MGRAHVGRRFKKTENAMKIKTTREGRPGIFLADKESLKEWVKWKGFKQIHNFVQAGPAIVGADHDAADVLADIDRATRVAVLTGSAKEHNLGHALALIIDNRLECFDIGEVGEEDLEITV